MLHIQRGDHCFYIGSSQTDTPGIIVWSDYDEHTIIIKATKVATELQGQNIGSLLLEKVIDYAKSEHKLIIPKCSFAKYKMEHTPEYEPFIKK